MSALEEIIRQMVREEVARSMPPPPEIAPSEAPYSEAEFCQRVGISRSLARRLRAQGKLGFYQVNTRTVRYSAEHERKFLESRERGKKRR